MIPREGQWRSVSLRHCCEIVSGATPRRNIPEYWGGDIAWVTPKDLSDLEVPVLEDTPEKITAKGLASCSAKLLPRGSILFSSRAPIGHIAITGREMCTNQGFKSLVPGPDVDSRYLYRCMRYITPQIVSKGRGATFKEVTKGIVEEVVIPLPPLEEQKRIAAILDKADAIRRKRQQAIKLTEQLLRSVFLDMFGDPVFNPCKWPVQSIDSFIASFDGGKNVKPDESANENTKHYILKVSAVTWGYFDSSEIKPLPPEYKPPENYLVRKGDLLISRANTVELIGATAYVRETPDNLVLPDKIWRFVWKEPLSVSPLFVHFLFAQPGVRADIGRRSSGTSGSMKNIPKSKLFPMKVPLPPLSLQDEFAQIVESSWRLMDCQQCQLSGQNDLFDSLVQRAFRRQLSAREAA